MYTIGTPISRGRGVKKRVGIITGPKKVHTIVLKIKMHSSCEVGDFVQTDLCKLRVILQLRVLCGVRDAHVSRVNRNWSWETKYYTEVAKLSNVTIQGSSPAHKKNSENIGLRKKKKKKSYNVFNF